MSVMTATRRRARAESPFALLPNDRPLTVEDLDLTPDDGSKYELDDGVLLVSPASVIVHQVVVTRLLICLAAACPPEFLVLAGPGVEMSRVQYRIPDLVVVREEDFDLTAKSLTNPPKLAIEVASPSTALYDRNRKKTVYGDFGIGSYWIVSPSLEKPSLTVFELRKGAYLERAFVAGDDVYRAERPFAVEICPARLVVRRRTG